MKDQVKCFAYLQQTKQNGSIQFSILENVCRDAKSNTGLIINEELSKGVIFRIMDVITGKTGDLKLWNDKYKL